ncbi:MAG: hypothetical protein KDI63_17090 [Gammaproteobacteria bacterium]|nr:hypothetical protein [Gammaproteobacteria bacterium]
MHRQSIAVDHRDRADEGIFLDFGSTHDRALGPQGGVATNMGIVILVLARNGGMGVEDIGKNHARDNVLLEGDVVIHRYAVLDVGIIARRGFLEQDYESVHFGKRLNNS